MAYLLQSLNLYCQSALKKYSFEKIRLWKDFDFTTKIHLILYGKSLHHFFFVLFSVSVLNYRKNEFICSEF